MNKLTTTAVLLLAATGVRADALFPSPSIPNVTSNDGWTIALGLEAEYEAEYDGSDDYGVEAEPGFLVQKRKGNQVWFLEGAELGWRARVRQQWLVQAGLRLEGGREEDEGPELAGLGDTDDELTAMLEVRRGFGDDWSNWLAARLMAGGNDIGTLGVLAAGHTFGANAGGTGLDVFAFATFGTADFLNRDFGVNAEQSAGSGLSLTELDGGYRSIGVTAVGRWAFRDNWQVQFEAGYERYNSDIAASPITLDDYEAEVGLSVLYLF